MLFENIKIGKHVLFSGILIFYTIKNESYGAFSYKKPNQRLKKNRFFIKSESDLGIKIRK